MYIQTNIGLGQVTTILDINKAIRNNRIYEQTLGWKKYFDDIAKLLGLSGRPSEIEFAQGVAQWQQSQGLKVDGMIGPSAWKVIQAAIIRTTSGASIQKVTDSVPTPQAELPLSAARVLSYSEVTDERISVPAQRSLMRLSRSKEPATSADAVGMLEAVKAGRLAGIYCVNWETSAQRALRLGASWWTVIPPGDDAVLMLDPDNPATGRPLIAFRRELDPRDKYGCGQLKTDTTLTPFPARLDAALLKAWANYKTWQNSSQPRVALVVHATDSGRPLAFTPFRLVVGPKQTHEGVTDASGALDVGPVGGGDYVLDILGVRMNVPALPPGEPPRPIRVRSDIPAGMAS